MEFQGRFYHVVKSSVRMLRKFRYYAPDRSAFTEPAVYVCRHKDNDGPIISMVNTPVPMHPWAYYVWCDEDECRKQCVEYTFTVRYGWSRKKAEWVADLISKPFTSLIRSAGAIPVYRNSLKVRETFRESVEALKRGESILIFPDVEYTRQDGDAGTLYDGFLMLDQFYLKATGAHVPFVPMHLSASERRMFIGEPVYIRDGVPFKDEKSRAILELQDRMNDMMKEHGV